MERLSFTTITANEVASYRNAIIGINHLIMNGDIVSEVKAVKFGKPIADFYVDPMNQTLKIGDAVITNPLVSSDVIGIRVIAAYIEGRNVLLIRREYVNNDEFIERVFRTVRRMLRNPKPSERALARLFNSYPNILYRTRRV